MKISTKKFTHANTADKFPSLMQSIHCPNMVVLFLSPILGVILCDDNKLPKDAVGVIRSDFSLNDFKKYKGNLTLTNTYQN